ncbi:aldo/keto reductase [Rhodanobacter koreensis]
MVEPVASTSGERSIGGLPGGPLKLSTLSFGGAPIGNLYQGVDEAVAAEAVERAWQLKVRHFDTAPYYGYGLSEVRLGHVLSGFPRDSFTLSTKVGRLIEDASGSTGHDGFAVDGKRAIFDYSRDGILRSVEASLKRLRTDRIDILLLHDIGELTHGERHPAILQQALAEALPTMAELRTQGVCRAIGIGVNEEAVCLQVMPCFRLDAIMLAGRYTLFEQARSERVMAMAQQQHVAILAAGPYNSGLLGAPGAPGHTYDYVPASKSVRARAQRFYDICAATGVDMGAAALQFPLVHPAVVTVVCGLRSADEVAVSVQRLEQRIPADTWQQLRNAELLGAQTRVPA